MKLPLRATLLAATLSASAACSDTVTGAISPDAATPADQPSADAPASSDGAVPPDGTVIGTDGAVPPDGTVIGTDGAVPPDGTIIRIDASVPPDGTVIGTDVTVPPDSTVIGSDVTVPPDGTVIGADVTPPPDGMVVPPDVPRVDGGLPSLLGRWRVVAWDYTSPDGTSTRLTDRDTPIPTPGGMPTPFRANGIFNVRPTRLSWSFGTLAAQHFYPYTPMRTDGDNYSATGTTAPGILDDAAGTFTVAGGMPVLRFERNADGTVAMDYTSGVERSRTTLARAPSSPTLANLNVVGVAQYRDAAIPRPMRHPRFALLWDRPGAAPLETNGAALTFRGAYATYFVVQAGAPPAEVQGRAYGVPAAVAFLFVYDDLNDNTTYDAPSSVSAGDESRGFGPLVIAWRGEGTPTAGFETSPLADLQPGWQVAHLHLDYGAGASTVTPFDTTVPVNPDVPVSTDALRGPVPHLVR